MTFIYFVIILGITIMIHELGHFIFAKKSGVYIYEFSLGMGPQIWKYKRKNDETIYSIRLFPIGGFVSMAGEDMEDNNIPKEKQLINKSWIERFSTIIAGIVFNFLLAIALLFIIGLINGVLSNKPVVAAIDEDYSLAYTNLKVGDLIVKVNDKKVSNSDMLGLLLQANGNNNVEIEVKHKDGTYEVVKTLPKIEIVNGIETYKYGFKLDYSKKYGLIPSIQYAFIKTGSLINQMTHIIGYLVTGKISMKSLSGPIGIYKVVDEVSQKGFLNILYLIAYLCINVGFINLIPLPAFDGGRLLFLIIEKIKGSKVDSKVENTIHSIGFLLLMILMLLVTYNDIIRLLK